MKSTQRLRSSRGIPPWPTCFRRRGDGRSPGPRMASFSSSRPPENCRRRPRDIRGGCMAGGQPIAARASPALRLAPQRTAGDRQPSRVQHRSRRRSRERTATERAQPGPVWCPHPSHLVSTTSTVTPDSDPVIRPTTRNPCGLVLHARIANPAGPAPCARTRSADAGTKRTCPTRLVASSPVPRSGRPQRRGRRPSPTPSACSCFIPQDDEIGPDREERQLPLLQELLDDDTPAVYPGTSTSYRGRRI